MKRETEVILGISLCTYISGIAIYSEQELLDWKLRYFRGKWDKGKLIKMLSALEKIIYRHQVTHLALKVPENHHHTKALQDVIKEIENLSSANALELHLFTLGEMKYYLADEEKANKRSIIDNLASKYPDLYMYYEKATLKAYNRYERIYEAVGAIELCRKELRMRKQE